MARWILLLCTVASLVLAGPVAAEDARQQPSVSVSATGFIMAEPEIARITIGVVTEAKTAKEALDGNSKKIAAVLQGIRQLGIAANDIATAHFRVTPIYNRRKSSAGRYSNGIDGFRVSNSARVTVRDIKQTGPVIDRATELGANQIGSIGFTVSALERRLDEARREAMRNAVRRAKLYAEAADAKLGKILSVSEQFHGVNPRVMAMGGAARMSAAAPIEPGQQKLGVTVNAVWELE